MECYSPTLWSCSRVSFGPAASSRYVRVIFEGIGHFIPRKHSEIVEDSPYLGLPYSHVYFQATLECTSAILETL